MRKKRHAALGEEYQPRHRAGWGIYPRYSDAPDARLRTLGRRSRRIDDDLGLLDLAEPPA